MLKSAELGELRITLMSTGAIPFIPGQDDKSVFYYTDS